MHHTSTKYLGSVRLGDHVVKIGSGYTPLGGYRAYQSSGIPLIRSQNVHMNRFEPEGLAYISEEQDAEMAGSRVCARDVLLNITGASIGRVCVAPDHFCPANVNQHVCVIRGDGTLDPDYLCLYFSSPHFQKFVWDSQAGATRQALTKGLIENLKIPLVELPEQQRMAAHLRAQLAEVESARKAVAEQLRAAEALPGALLREEFSLPDSRWPRRRLGDLLRLRKDLVHPRNNPQGKTIFVGLEHIESQTGRRIASMPIEMADLTGRKPRFFKGDIVYGYLRPYLNKVWLADFDGLCSVEQYVFSVGEEADREFVAWFMRSPQYLNRAPIDKTPGQLPRIRTEEVAAVEIELPPLPEQRRIAAKIDKLFQASYAVRERLIHRLADIEKLSFALLREAFTGAT
ncbi:MAG TPA: restriction endonuclease subunit S [Kiritimatiellia bacterium]|nr:restriction endonuclease subunit S [Kiritimatiellia bacterium]